MYRVRNRRSYWRTKWPWKKFFPPKVDERFCEKCEQLYQNGPMPKAIDSVISGSVEAKVFPSGTWKRNELTVAFGRCRASGRQLYLSQYYTLEEMVDVIRAAVHASRKLAVLQEQMKKEQKLLKKKVQPQGTQNPPRKGRHTRSPEPNRNRRVN